MGGCVDCETLAYQKLCFLVGKGGASSRGTIGDRFFSLLYMRGWGKLMEQTDVVSLMQGRKKTR